MSTHDDFIKHTNPVIQGPGTWNVLHTLSYNANNRKDQLQYIKSVKIICGQFPCPTCRNHAAEYIKNHKLEDYLYNEPGDELNMFLWTWKFHNTVNHRLDKNEMSWEMAIHMYENLKNPIQEDNIKFKKNQCSKECSGEEPKKSNQVQKNHHKLYMKEKYKK